MTIKDLFIKENNYIVEFKVSIILDYYYVYIEGLDKYGCAILGKFDIRKIKTLCIELIDSDGDFKTIDNLGIDLNTSIETLIKRIEE